MVLAFPILLPAQQLIDGIAAIVGDKIVLKSDVFQLAQLNALQSGINIESNPEVIANYQKTALENLVIQNILLDRARVDSLDIIEDEEVDQALDQQIDMFLQQVGSVDQFEAVIGQNIRSFKKEQWYSVRDQIIAERYRSEVIKSVNVTRDEVINFYDTYRDSLPPVGTRYELSQMVLPISPGKAARDSAFEKITNIKFRLEQGETFTDLARTYSDDIESRVVGGNIGFVRRGEFVQRFEEAAFALEEGQISDIVETPFGYHIIQLLEKQGERINVNHILINITPSTEDRERVLNLIRDYYFALEQDPELFDSILVIVSPEESENQGIGYVGWVEDNSLPSESYRTALFGTKPGDITPPFETPDGFNILKVLSIKDGGVPTLEEYYPQIEEYTLNNKQFKYMEKWLERIRNDVFIKVLL